MSICLVSICLVSICLVNICHGTLIQGYTLPSTCPDWLGSIQLPTSDSGRQTRTKEVEAKLKNDAPSGERVQGRSSSTAGVKGERQRETISFSNLNRGWVAANVDGQ